MLPKRIRFQPKVGISIILDYKKVEQTLLLQIIRQK